MTYSRSTIALSLVCLATSMGTVVAQQAAPTIPLRQGASTAPASNLAAPGHFTGMTSATSVEIKKPLIFHLAGSGYCKLKLDGGDGQSSEVAGILPFSAEHVYSGASMSSFDAFKNYKASAIPMGNCKTEGAGPFSVAVQAINPNPQSAGTPPKDNTVVLAGAGKLLTPVKPLGTDGLPSVTATITAIAVTSKALTGAPNVAAGSVAPVSMEAGSPTLLTVSGTGICKFHLSYVNLDAMGNLIAKQYPMLPKASSLQSPFPMSMTLMPATPAGIYKWTASGVDGCTGSKDVTFAVK